MRGRDIALYFTDLGAGRECRESVTVPAAGAGCCEPGGFRCLIRPGELHGR
jgi:hypothetical protein